MDSWYYNHGDTIDLVAHTGVLQTVAFLVKFIKGKPSAYFLRAPHDVKDSRYFEVNKEDTFSHFIEVPLTSYRLRLSALPDTSKKQMVFGFVNMESGEYYDKRDSVQLPRRVQMKFYFQSHYRKFDF